MKENIKVSDKKFWIGAISIWMPIFIWAIVIFSFSSIPSAHVSEIHWKDFIVKKSAHMTEYGIFAVLLYRAFLAQGVTQKRAGVYAIVLCFLYGITDEFHQSFTPGREPAFRDVLFDTIGGALATLIIWNILPKAPPKLKELLVSLQIL